jgi:hypothetical protein
VVSLALAELGFRLARWHRLSPPKDAALLLRDPSLIVFTEYGIFT